MIKTSLITNIKYFFRRKYEQISRVIDFLPLIWNSYDFDYRYSLDIFKKQLKRQEKYLLSDRAHLMYAENTASRIRTAIELMDKVYDEEYFHEYQDKLKELYGEDVLEWKFIETEDLYKGEKMFQMGWKYEDWDNADEISEVKDRLFRESKEKQERAHRILWSFIEHNIQRWWD
jgi:hypothetical protein